MNKGLLLTLDLPAPFLKPVWQEALKPLLFQRFCAVMQRSPPKPEQKIAFIGHAGRQRACSIMIVLASY